MGLGRLPHFQGRDLRRLPAGQTLEIFEETYKPEAKRDRFGLLAYPWHLIFTPELQKIETYDLGADPGEIADVLSDRQRPVDVVLRAELGGVSVLPKGFAGGGVKRHDA